MLDLTTTTHEAVNADEVTVYSLFEFYYDPPNFNSGEDIGVGAIRTYDGLVYEAIENNPSPAVAPYDSSGSSYWNELQYPFCLTDWSESVAYNGNVYNPATIKLGEVSTSDDGRISDTTLSIGTGHDDMTIMKLVEEYELIGKQVKIVTIIEGATDQPSITFKVKAAKPKKGQLDLTLSLGFGYFMTQVPGRTIYQNFCRHRKFKDLRCKYSGSDTTCTRTFEDCQNKGNIINFGGFPGIVKKAFFF